MLVSVAEQASLTWSETPEDKFSRDEVYNNNDNNNNNNWEEEQAHKEWTHQKTTTNGGALSLYLSQTRNFHINIC